MLSGRGGFSVFRLAGKNSADSKKALPTVWVAVIAILYGNGLTIQSHVVQPVHPLEKNVFADYRETTNNLNIDMVAVQGGTFTMGCTSEQSGDCFDTEKPAHQVTVSDYYIGKYEVTQAQWRAVMGTTVRQQRDKADTNLLIVAGDSFPIVGEGDNYPMYYVSWNDAQEFVSKLNSMTGKKYRLPTEAEWEYAARGGKKSQGYKYSGGNMVGSVAWFAGNSGNSTHAVGTKSSNELGIFDMSGNVREWCSDWKGAYNSSAQTDPKGASSGSYRVNRGGSWLIFAGGERVSERADDTPGRRYYYLGFRLACSLK
jgi:formylglycine-generating enzyme required for sulfatase activity